MPLVNCKTLWMISSFHSPTSTLFTLVIFLFTQCLFMNVINICILCLTLLDEMLLLFLLRKLNCFKPNFDYLVMIFFKARFDLSIVLSIFQINFSMSSLTNFSMSLFERLQSNPPTWSNIHSSLVKQINIYVKTIPYLDIPTTNSLKLLKQVSGV